MLQDDDVTFWQDFSVVIVSGGKPTELEQLSRVLWDLNIPLVVIDSIGFFGSIFISLKEHTGIYRFNFFCCMFNLTPSL